MEVPVSEAQHVAEATPSRSSTARALRERRKEFRYPTQDPVEINTQPPQGRPIPATVLDVSKSGMRVELTRPLSRCSRIEVLIPASKLVIFGEVRYCRRADAGFHVGIRIEDVIRPTPYPWQHLHEDEISLFIVGKGLTTAEVFRVEDHLSQCSACSGIVTSTAAALYQAVRRFAPRR